MANSSLRNKVVEMRPVTVQEPGLYLELSAAEAVFLREIIYYVPVSIDGCLYELIRGLRDAMDKVPMSSDMFTNNSILTLKSNARDLLDSTVSRWPC